MDGVGERSQLATTSTSVLRSLFSAVSTALNEHMRALRQLSQSKLSLELSLHFGLFVANKLSSTLFKLLLHLLADAFSLSCSVKLLAVTKQCLLDLLCLKFLLELVLSLSLFPHKLVSFHHLELESVLLAKHCKLHGPGSFRTKQVVRDVSEQAVAVLKQHVGSTVDSGLLDDRVVVASKYFVFTC